MSQYKLSGDTLIFPHPWEPVEMPVAHIAHNCGQKQAAYEAGRREWREVHGHLFHIYS